MFLSKRALIGVILAGSLAVSASAAFVKTGSYTEGQFADVPATEWYASEVASAFELGLMNGTGGGLSPLSFNGYLIHFTSNSLICDVMSF